MRSGWVRRTGAWWRDLDDEAGEGSAATPRDLVGRQGLEPWTLAIVQSIMRPAAAFLLCSFTACSPGPGLEDAKWTLERVIEVAGRQGVSTDGERYFVSGSTSLHVYEKDGTLVAENTSPFEALTRRANHIGDISYHDGELYAGIEWFEDGVGSNIQVAVYDADTLEYQRSIDWQPDSGQKEVSAVAVDPAGNSIWMTDWTEGRYVYRYALDTGAYAGKLHLRPIPQWQQGIAVLDGHLYITADDGDAEESEMDSVWRAPAVADRTATFVEHVHTLDEVEHPGEIEGIAFDPATGEMLVLHNRGKLSLIHI